MFKNDRLFVTVIGICALSMLLLMRENIPGAQSAVSVTSSVGEGGITTPPLQEDVDESVRTAEIRKKFEYLHLPLHEGKYWKETP